MLDRQRRRHSWSNGATRDSAHAYGALAAAIAAWLAIPNVCAQDATPSVVIDVGDCVNLKSPGERLDCYERHVEAAKRHSEASAGPAPQASPAAAAPASPDTAAVAAAAGASADSAGRTRPPAHDAAVKPEIVATVTEVHETVPNALLITLDNGQVWRQNIPQRFALTTGQRVTLHGTKWGSSYRLSADTLSGFIQVERVR